MMSRTALLMLGASCFALSACKDDTVADHTHDHNHDTNYAAPDHEHAPQTFRVTNADITAAAILAPEGAPCTTGTSMCEADGKIKTCVDGVWGTPGDCPNIASGDKCWFVWDQAGWRAACTRDCKSSEAAAAKKICHQGKTRTCVEHFHPPYLWTSIHYGAPTDCTSGQVCKQLDGTTGVDGSEGSCQAM